MKPAAAQTTHPNGTTATWTYGYDGFGLLATVTAPDGEVTTWPRDAEQRVKTITHNDKDGTSTETFAYDADNDITSDVIARGSDVGKSTSYGYNALGKVYQVKGSHGQVLTYGYDGNGNVLSATDALAHKTSYVYDALDRIVGITNAANGITSYTYDAGDHVTGVEDPRGLVTSYAWDGLGQLWQQVSPDTGTTTLQYDAYGRLFYKQRADGMPEYFGYDALNRMVSRGTTEYGSQGFTWDSCTDGIGRLCASTTGASSVGYSYSPEGWITGRSFSISGGSSYALGYSYDNMGHLSVVDYPDGNQVLYYYTDGAVSQVNLQVGKYLVVGVNGITYRPMDLAMSGWTSYNGAVNTILYDSDLRPTYIGVHDVEGLHFAYDPANRITQIKNDDDPGMLTASLTYDNLDRLTDISSTAENESYQYDADGNRISQIINGVTSSFAYPPTSNRLTSVSGGLNGTFGYNANGDTVAVNGLATYTYDPFERLVNAADTTFTVSAEGQRLEKTSAADGTTYFAPDASGPLLAEDQNGDWMDYVWLNGRVVTVISNGGVFPLHDDQTGRPLTMTDPASASQIDWMARGLPFDRTVTANHWGNFNLGFPGQYFDEEDSLWHNGNRDYDASLGRYTEPDPLALGGGINSYAYAGSNPISNIDPLGLCPSKKCQDALKAVGANAAALDRAMANMPAIDVAASEFNLDPAFLGAMGIRESGFRNIPQNGGRGMGVFQIDQGQNPTVTASEAGNIWEASEYAAAYLSANMATLGKEYPNFTPGQLLQATAASYNLGVGGISGDPNTIDVGTRPNGDYGSSVINLMSCFQDQ